MMPSHAVFRCWKLLIALVCFVFAGRLAAQQEVAVLEDEVRHAMKQACAYYHGEVASHGGYVYYYDLDLRNRWGEGKVSESTIIVQPPGTPTVGTAYLGAYEATGDRFYREAGRDAAEALVAGQLDSGGWTQAIHFEPPKRGRMGDYRKRAGGSWNYSSLDDGQTQAALNMLMRADRAFDFRHETIHEAVRYGLDALLEAQFPIGAFPQVWTEPVAAQPIRQARFPDYDWRTEGRIKEYWHYYTLNDQLAGSVSETLILAHRIYGDACYLEALKKLGDFLILAQMPDPQPGWCQQYNYRMYPIWGRKFEPPAITGWESQDVMRTLIKIYHYTKDEKYLRPIPDAVTYFTERCLLPDGKVARYYEFRTNRPLYMNHRYELTHDASAAPSHYGWQQEAHFQEIERMYRNALEGIDPEASQLASESEESVRGILRQMDRKGRWVSTYSGERLVGQPDFHHGFRSLSSAVFSKNIEALSAYLLRSAESFRPNCPAGM
jgi:PelA/Pel-15E family pectate lyase